MGKTGIKVPIVSMGTYDATDVVNAALDAGIVHIDTSAEYNEGNDERMFGEVLKGRPRDSFVIGTSIGMWQYRDADQINMYAYGYHQPAKARKILTRSAFWISHAIIAIPAV